MSRILQSVPTDSNSIPPPRWKLTFISYLLVAIQARDAFMWDGARRTRKAVQA